MACSGGPGVQIGNCFSSFFYNGNSIADQGTDPISYQFGQPNNLATFPESDANLRSLFDDAGGGFCTYPISGGGLINLTGIRNFDFTSRNIGLGDSTPIWMVKITAYGNINADSTLTLQNGIITGIDVNSAPAVYNGPAGQSPFSAYFRLKNGTDPWTWGDLFDINQFRMVLSGSTGTMDLCAAYLEIWFGVSSAETVLILQEDPDGPTEEFTTDDVTQGGIEFGGDPIKVLSVDSSGLYVLTEGKTDDTLYTRNVGDSSVDVAIPDPNVVTGPMGD